MKIKIYKKIDIDWVYLTFTIIALIVIGVLFFNSVKDPIWIWISTFLLFIFSLYSFIRLIIMKRQNKLKEEIINCEKYEIIDEENKNGKQT